MTECCRLCKKEKKIVMFGYCEDCIKEQGGLIELKGREQ